jgi:hypothetical protein
MELYVPSPYNSFITVLPRADPLTSPPLLMPQSTITVMNLGKHRSANTSPIIKRGEMIAKKVYGFK